MLPKFTVVCFFSTTSWSLGDVPLSPISLNPCSKLGDGLPKPQKLSWKKFRWRESELDTPVMLTGSAMHKWWKKKKHWAPREIKRVAVRRNKTLKGVRVKTGSQELLFGNPTRAVKRLDHELLDMDPTTFFSDLMDTPKLRRESKTLYYTSHINSSVAPQLLFPKSVRSVICRAFFYPPCDRVERYMTWISSAGAVARLHLDFPHNLYLHAHGTKTMVLLHPKIHRKLRLHPRWHPSSRQSQLSCGQLQEAFGEDGLESDYGFRVIMRPGDVLYLPPMWFHMAEVGEAGPAVSVNVWMGSDESRAVYTLYNDTVHDGLIPKGTDMRATFLVARKYIDALLKAIYKDDHGSVVLRHLDERYWPEAPWKSRHRFHESRMYRRVEKICNDTVGLLSDDAVGLKQETRGKIANLVKTINNEFQFIELSRRDILMGEYIDYFSLFVLKAKLRTVGETVVEAFIRRCLFQTHASERTNTDTREHHVYSLPVAS